MWKEQGGMWKLMGFGMVLVGSLGMAWNVCWQNRMRLAQLKQVKEIYENLKYYISYQRAAIPEALWLLSERTGPPFTKAFEEISLQLQEGADFQNLWEGKMERALEETCLKKTDGSLLLGFPSFLGFMEEGAQAAALDAPIREIEKQILELEREQKDKNKVIMSVGVAGGLLLAILLL